MRCIAWVSCLTLLYTTAQGSQPEIIDIFTPTPRFPCFRQPAVIRGVDANHVLAFAENRNVTACAPAARGLSSPHEVGSLQLRRSSDGGKTWGPLQSLYVGNIDFYSPIRDKSSGKIWVFLQAKKDVRVLSSADDGATWEEPEPFTVTGGVPQPFTGFIKPTCGHGLQLEDDLCGTTACTDAGRLLVPFVCVNGSAHGDKGVVLADHSCIIYSDDHGSTWRFGGVGPAGTREAQVVQTMVDHSNGHSGVYMNERNMGKTPGHRMWSRSDDGGLNFPSSGMDMGLVSPVTPHWTGIVGSVSRIRAGDSKSRIAYSGPTDPKSRSSLGVYLSYDEAQTWSAPKIIWDGPSAYSDTVPLSGGTLGIIFENGNATFADRISFARAPLSWMEDTVLV